MTSRCRCNITLDMLNRHCEYLIQFIHMYKQIYIVYVRYVQFNMLYLIYLFMIGIINTIPLPLEQKINT